MVTVRDTFFDVMRDLGLTTVFGNPGSTEEDFLARFPADFRYVLGLQEASVVGIADGYAQATDAPAFVNLHTVAGLGNALGNIATARMNKTPLIVTAGQQHRRMLLMEPWLTNTDATTFPRPHVKWSYETARAQDAPAALVRAHAHAVQPPQGPVFLSLPLDDWAQEADPTPAPRQVATRVGPDPDRLRAFAQAFAAAEAPALLLGADVDRAGAWDLGVRLAESTRATVYAPPASERVSFPEDHPQFAGHLPFAIGPLGEALTGHDLVLVVGAPVFRYYPYVPGDLLSAGTTLLHITDDPSEAARAPIGDALVADAGLALRAMLDHLSELPPATRRAPRHDHAPAPAPTGSPMVPDALFAAVAAARPDDAVVVEESPSNLVALHRHLPVTRPKGFVTMASGGLGFGLPAAVGVALGEAATGRHRPVLAVVGDGSFQYSIQSLATAAAERARMTVVVPRNHEYGILKAFAEQQHTPGVPGLDLPAYDVVGLARAYGCAAARATTPAEVTDLVRAAQDHDGPTVVEAVIDPAVPPLL